MAKPVLISDATFKAEVLDSETPVLVDFWAAWCGPCRMMAPVVEQMAEEYQGRLKVAKLDVDANTRTPQEYGIRGIPTLLLFKKGTLVDQIVGAVSGPVLKRHIDDSLAMDTASASTNAATR